MKIHKYLFRNPGKFPGTIEYWKKRYAQGGTSGLGSYNYLAEFKAEILNSFVKKEDIKNIIEFGCGDGNQLKYAKYPAYKGYDVSKGAIDFCRKIFENDKSKKFDLIQNFQNEKAELSISLDVVYLLIEDQIFFEYMHRLFNSSEKFVIIYSSDFDSKPEFHQRHRNFTSWINQEIEDWKFIEKVPNKYPYNPETKKGSMCSFYIYQKK